MSQTIDSAARIAQLVQRMKDHAPYLDSPADRAHPFGPGKLEEALSDGVVSYTNEKDLKKAADSARRCAEHQAGKTPADIRWEAALRRADEYYYQRYGEEDIYMMAVDNKFDEKMARFESEVPQEEIDRGMQRAQDKAEWYMEGAKLADMLCAAVVEKRAQQPLSQTMAEEAKDRAAEFRRRHGI